MNSLLKTLAVIPCYNESSHIGKVVTKAKKYVDLVVVADAQSTDSTRRIARKCGADAVIVTGKPVGPGDTTWQGIKWAMRELRPDVIVLLDGDGQHDPAEIPVVLAP